MNDNKEPREGKRKVKYHLSYFTKMRLYHIACVVLFCLGMWAIWARIDYEEEQLLVRGESERAIQESIYWESRNKVLESESISESIAESERWSSCMESLQEKTDRQRAEIRAEKESSRLAALEQEKLKESETEPETVPSQEQETVVTPEPETTVTPEPETTVTPEPETTTVKETTTQQPKQTTTAKETTKETTTAQKQTTMSYDDFWKMMGWDGSEAETAGEGIDLGIKEGETLSGIKVGW